MNRHGTGPSRRLARRPREAPAQRIWGLDEVYLRNYLDRQWEMLFARREYEHKFVSFAMVAIGVVVGGFLSYLGSDHPRVVLAAMVCLPAIGGVVAGGAYKIVKEHEAHENIGRGIRGTYKALGGVVSPKRGASCFPDDSCACPECDEWFAARFLDLKVGTGTGHLASIRLLILFGVTSAFAILVVACLWGLGRGA